MKIEILEDHQGLGRILQISLRFAGHSVHTSQTIVDFLTYVSSPASVDLIIVDFRLLAEHSETGLTGADVIRHVRTMFPDLPAILISAVPLAKLEAATIGLPKVKVLQKPFKTATLLEMIKEIT
jgi:CheY-like chemotaxis protein